MGAGDLGDRRACRDPIAGDLLADGKAGGTGYTDAGDSKGGCGADRGGDSGIRSRDQRAEPCTRAKGIAARASVEGIAVEGVGRSAADQALAQSACGGSSCRKKVVLVSSDQCRGTVGGIHGAVSRAALNADGALGSRGVEPIISRTSPHCGGGGAGDERGVAGVGCGGEGILLGGASRVSDADEIASANQTKSALGGGIIEGVVHVGSHPISARGDVPLRPRLDGDYRSDRFARCGCRGFAGSGGCLGTGGAFDGDLASMEAKNRRVILVEDGGHLLIGEGDSTDGGGEERSLVTLGLGGVKQGVDVMTDLLEEDGFLQILRAI